MDHPIEPTASHPRVLELAAQLRGISYQGAVVDLLGRYDETLKPITPGHPGRFELRSRAHVQSYGFKVVEANYV